MGSTIPIHAHSKRNTLCSGTKSGNRQRSNTHNRRNRHDNTRRILLLLPTRLQKLKEKNTILQKTLGYAVAINSATNTSGKTRKNSKNRKGICHRHKHNVARTRPTGTSLETYLYRYSRKLALWASSSAR